MVEVERKLDVMAIVDGLKLEVAVHQASWGRVVEASVASGGPGRHSKLELSSYESRFLADPSKGPSKV